MKLKPFGDNIICTDADFGDQTTESGIIIKSNVEKSQGITPRWFRVFAVGEDISSLTPGQWVLVQYGRWTESFEFDDDRESETKKFWKVDPDGCLAVADQKPDTLYYNRETVTAEKMVRQ